MKQEMGVELTKKKILILSANPKDASRLRLDEEVREIEDGLNRSKNRHQFIIQSKLAVRLRDLRRTMLDYEPNIVHFCGHGEEKGLMVEDENGNVTFASPDALSGLFELFSDHVECVLLNACYSQIQANAISQHIHHVIGMKRGIKDKAALEFAVGFYDALGAGKTVEEAFKFGCNAIELYNIPKPLTPILKKRGDWPAKGIENRLNSDDITKKFDLEKQDAYKKGLVFVLMPLTGKYTEIYSQVIKPTVNELEYECVKADEIAKPGNINKEIAEYISRAVFIIADLTDANPNVMYELGLSHALGRITIMISQATELLPFDISTYRVIKYSQSIEGYERLKIDLHRFIQNIDLARRETSNPVSDFLGGPHKSKFAKQLMTPLECFTSLCQTLEAFISQKAEDEDVKLLRALPTEMSPKTFHKIGASTILMEKYETLIKEYVEKPDLDDETVFGCPPNFECLRETLAKIKTSYFAYPSGPNTESLMEVSAVGFHPYLKGYSLFLIGRKKKWDDDPEQYDTGFIFFLNRYGVPINGIHTSDEQTIRILLHLWNLILEEITHETDGVPLKRFLEYNITQDNHEVLFRSYIANRLLSKFNQINDTNWQLKVESNSDKIKLLEE